jgi:hypothetical protein
MTKPLFFSNFFLQPFTEEKPKEREREREREMGTDTERCAQREY